jgi:hypothetical protein
VTERRAREAARGRGAGRCELCRSTDAVEASHRISRSRLGPWSPPNILALCSKCHRWCHANPVEARLGGWFLDTDTDPTEVAVYVLSVGLPLWGWVLLDGDGDAHPVDTDAPPPAVFPPGVTTPL